jgi:hypothetical protein
MRYRIQIQPMLDTMLCVIATYDDYGNVMRISSRMYTVSLEQYEHGGLVELLGELQRVVGESTP